MADLTDHDARVALDGRGRRETRFVGRVVCATHADADGGWLCRASPIPRAGVPGGGAAEHRHRGVPWRGDVRPAAPGRHGAGAGPGCQRHLSHGARPSVSGAYVHAVAFGVDGGGLPAIAASASALGARGSARVSGGTHDEIVLVDLTPRGLTGVVAERALSRAEDAGTSGASGPPEPWNSPRRPE